MKKIDRIGDRYGRLVVVRISPEKDYRGINKWECICDCGRTLHTDAVRLSNGETTSCGCSRTDLSVEDAKHLCLRTDFKKFKGGERRVYADYIKHVLRKYGLYEYELRRIMDEQKGCCAICGKSLDHLRVSGCVDHDHNTGKVRGLLCYFCNHGIGSLMDSVNNLKSAIKYLEGG